MHGKSRVSSVIKYDFLSWTTLEVNGSKADSLLELQTENRVALSACLSF